MFWIITLMCVHISFHTLHGLCRPFTKQRIFTVAPTSWSLSKRANVSLALYHLRLSPLCHLQLQCPVGGRGHIDNQAVKNYLVPMTLRSTSPIHFSFPWRSLIREVNWIGACLLPNCSAPRLKKSINCFIKRLSPVAHYLLAGWILTNWGPIWWYQSVPSVQSKHTWLRELTDGFQMINIWIWYWCNTRNTSSQTSCYPQLPSAHNMEDISGIIAAKLKSGIVLSQYCRVLSPPHIKCWECVQKIPKG